MLFAISKSFFYDKLNFLLIFSKMSKSFSKLIVTGALLLNMISPFMLTVSAQSGNLGVDPSIVPPAITAATGGEQNIISLVRTIINYFLGFLGIVVLALVIYGGLLYVTAGVNEGGADTGKKIITYAVIGVVIILLSYVFVNTLLSIGTGTPRGA